jgi:hypothetical protein
LTYKKLSPKTIPVTPSTFSVSFAITSMPVFPSNNSKFGGMPTAAQLSLLLATALSAILVPALVSSSI